jgi:hypothetical protein
MKAYLKILAVLVSVALLWLGSSYLLYLRDHPIHCSNTITMTGEITSEMFVQARDCLVRFADEKKTFVVKEAAGGDGYTALAIAILIHRHKWDVEVVDICASACANWIFPAGRTKYLNRQSMLLFHGGPHQANILERIDQIEHMTSGSGTPVDKVELGRKNQEGTVRWAPMRTPADEEVLEFLSINKDSRGAEKWGQFRNASDRFYQELGIKRLLPEYGQIGRYEPSYKSDEYSGFIYRLDSLRRFGISNIELKDGEWRPERHPAYPEVYEVTFP